MKRIGYAEIVMPLLRNQNVSEVSPIERFVMDAASLSGKIQIRVMRLQLSVRAQPSGE